jgi:hypothetical protein
MINLRISALVAGLIACGPAIAADGTPHCYTLGISQTLVTDLFNRNAGAVKLGLTAENVVLGGGFPEEPGVCYVEVTTNTGRLMKYKFRYDHSEATIDLIR